MTFGSSGSRTSGDPRRGNQTGTGNANNSGSNTFNPMNTGGAPFTPRSPLGSILLSGLMGLQRSGNPALSSSFSKGGGGGLGRRPALVGRVNLGGL